MALGRGPTVISTGAAASDRRTFGELKRELASGFNPDDDNTLSLAGAAINQAVRRYNRFDWPWEIVSQDITISSGTSLYALDQPFKKPLAAYLLDSNSRPDERLGYMPYESFANLSQQNLSAGLQPNIYTIPNAHEGGQVQFYPIPGAADTARLFYYRRTPTGKLDSDPMEWTAEAEGAIYEYAWYYFLIKLAGADAAARLPLARADAIKAHAELVSMAADRGDVIGLL